MSQSLVNLLIHIMWTTHNQLYSFSQPLKNDLYAYITALIKSKNGKVIAIGGSNDHLHLLISLPPDIALSTLMGHMKAYSSKWLKSRENMDQNFSWQNGYLAMSSQENRIDHVCTYIRSDELRHQSKKYSEELVDLLKKQNIKYVDKYLLQNSYSKILVHAIWSTYNRTPCLDSSIRQNLYNKICDVVTSSRGTMHEIGGIEDHIHFFMEMPRDKALSDLIRDIKTTSAHWLKNQNRSQFHEFEWQSGYGAFTVSLSSLNTVKQYIRQQDEHHRKQSFQDEWKDFVFKQGELIN